MSEIDVGHAAECTVLEDFQERLNIHQTYNAALKTLVQFVLTGADRKPVGYLGKLSEQFGLYLGDGNSSQWGQEIVRLLFVNRRPIRIIKTQRFGQAEEIVNSINAFVAEHPLP